jgi:hypothetical protein
MVNGCEECARLWRDYAMATHEHFHLDSKLQLAGLSHDHEGIQKLAPLVTDSCRRRIAVREEITRHESASHNGAAGRWVHDNPK